jgi:hypothetical protein
VNTVITPVIVIIAISYSVLPRHKTVCMGAVYSVVLCVLTATTSITQKMYLIVSIFIAPTLFSILQTWKTVPSASAVWDSAISNTAFTTSNTPEKSGPT